MAGAGAGWRIAYQPIAPRASKQTKAPMMSWALARESGLVVAVTGSIVC